MSRDDKQCLETCLSIAMILEMLKRGQIEQAKQLLTQVMLACEPGKR